MNITKKMNPGVKQAESNLVKISEDDQQSTPIQRCVHTELRRYFDMLDGEEPSQLYRMVVRQAEEALLEAVMRECRGNQTRAALWLGISRGNLRNKLSNLGKS